MKLLKSSLILVSVSMASWVYPMEKVIEEAEISWGVSERQGDRKTMEDAHIHEKVLIGDQQGDYFGIFDGHGGVQAARYAARNAVSFFVEKVKISEENQNDMCELIKCACIDSYKQLDEAICNSYCWEGTTALSVILMGHDLYVAWAGDSRALVVDNKGALKKVTVDHRPHNEKERIPEKYLLEQKETGKLRIGNRQGSVSFSRSLGDRDVKKLFPNVILAVPEFFHVPVEQDDVIVLACDGLWDVLSQDDVIKFFDEHRELSRDELHKKFPTKQHNKNKKACEEGREGPVKDGEPNELTLLARGLRDLAYERKSSDNISVMIIKVPE